MKNLTNIMLVLILALPISAASGINGFEGQFSPGNQAVSIRFNKIQSLMYRETAGVQFENSGNADFGAKSLSPFNAEELNTPYLINFFSYPITSFALDFGDKDPDTDILIIRAYSDYQGKGNLLAEVSDTLPSSRDFTQKRLTIEATGIKSIVFIGGSEEKPNSVFYDNFRAASEPVRASFNDPIFSYADFAVFRAGTFYALQFAGDFAYKAIPSGEGKPVTGDYDGDNLTDATVFRNGLWRINLSANNQLLDVQFGQAGDIPVSADFDNDGRTDIAVFRAGNWYVLRSSDLSFMAVHFGQAGDVPIPANFDGDGRADYAVFRAGTWYILRTKDGFRGIQFGLSTDKPVAADYDGDGIADIAVFRAGVWYLLQSKEGFRAEQFGQAGDIPVPNDYFVDIPLNYSNGKADIAVFRPESGTWFVRTPSGFYARQWGQAGDVPISLAP